MDNLKKFTLDKIRSIFTTKRSFKKREKPLKAPAMHLNFFLLNAVLKHIQTGISKKPLSLFTTKILNSKSKNLEALIKQSESVCSKQDIELFSYKEFFSRNQLALRNAVQWNLPKYIKTKEQAETLINKMKEATPESFKQHLIILLHAENLSEETITQEAKRLEDEWKIYQQGQASTAPVTRISPI
jgi:hypothetical protein